MNDIINEDVIEKVVIKSVAIYKAMSVLPAPLFEDKFKKETIICQQNEIIQSPNLEKCLSAIEPSKENEITDTTNEIKSDYEKKSWKDITNPKERKKAYNKAWREVNKDKIMKQSKDYYDNNQYKIKEYYQNNKEKINFRNKVWRETNKDKKKTLNKDWIENNKEKQKIYRKQYREKNKSIIKEKKRLIYQKEKEKINEQNRIRYNQDINYKLKCRLRHRLRMALKKDSKTGSAVKDLGCNIGELKSYLESKFSTGMTWDNHSIDGWHIDHIKPLASFDLTDKKQFLEACHYTNLQPLWAKDNMIKGDKVI